MRSLIKQLYGVLNQIMQFPRLWRGVCNMTEWNNSKKEKKNVCFKASSTNRGAQSEHFLGTKLQVENVGTNRNKSMCFPLVENGPICPTPLNWYRLVVHFFFLIHCRKMIFNCQRYKIKVIGLDKVVLMTSDKRGSL